MTFDGFNTIIEMFPIRLLPSHNIVGMHIAHTLLCLTVTVCADVNVIVDVSVTAVTAVTVAVSVTETMVGTN